MTNTYTLLTYYPDKPNPVKSQWTGKGQVPLDVLYDLISTDVVQVVPEFRKIMLPDQGYRRCTAWVDEEGVLKGRPMNRYATSLWGSVYSFAHPIVGPMVVVIKETEK